VFGKLHVQQLEELASESQALVDKARAMVTANLNALTPAIVTSSRAPMQNCGAPDRNTPTSISLAQNDGTLNGDPTQEHQPQPQLQFRRHLPRALYRENRPMSHPLPRDRWSGRGSC